MHFTQKCSFTNSEELKISITNNSYNYLCNVPVKCVITHPTQPTQTVNAIVSGPIPYHTIGNVSFGNVDLSDDSGLYTLTGTVEWTDDPNAANNTIVRTVKTNITVDDATPYSENFNSGNGGWVSDGTKNKWHCLTFNKPSGFSSTDNAWVTIPWGTYEASELNYLYSPQFDLTNLTCPTVTLDVKYYTESASYDWGKLQYSTDGGATFPNTVAKWGGGTSPYDWSSLEFSLPTLAGETCVIFRFEFRSDGGSQREGGFAMDNFTIENRDTDISPTALVEPLTKDYCERLLTETVKVTIYNQGCSPASNIPLSVVITGPIPQSFSETVPGPIPANSSITYTCVNTINMSAVGTYNFTITTSLPADHNNSNDVLNATREILVFQPIVNTFPYSEDFNSGNGNWILDPNNNANSSWELNTFTKMGGNTGYGDSWITKQTGDYNAGETGYILSPIFDLSTLSCPFLEFDTKYFSENGYDYGQVYYSTNGGTSWSLLGLSTDPNWYNSSNKFTGGATDIEWQHVKHSLSPVQGESCVMFRFYFRSDGGVQRDGGFAFDNIEIVEFDNDLSVIDMTKPVGLISYCDRRDNEQVEVEIYNDGCTSISNFPLTVEMTGTHTANFTETVPGPIAPNTSITYICTNTVNLSDVGTYNFDIHTDYAPDPNNANDNYITAVDVDVYQPIINTFPYNEDFNSGDGDWILDPNNNASSSLVLGSFTKMGGNTGFGDSWITKLTGDYNTNEVGYILSPIYDLSSLTCPTIEFDTKYFTETGADYGQVFYSTNGGDDWTLLGLSTDPNWYNSSNKFTGGAVDIEWQHVKHSLSPVQGESCVMFRFYFRSDGGVQKDGGFAFDNIYIGEMANDVGITSFDDPVSNSELCERRDNDQVTVTVFNNSCADITNVPIKLEMTGAGTANLSETIIATIPTGGTISYTFTGTVDMTAIGTYHFKVYTDLVGDGYTANDDVETDIIVSNYLQVETLPYSEDFNSGDGDWQVGGTNSSWELNSFTLFGGNTNYGNSWVTNASGDYNVSENSYVMSPIFDLTTATNCTYLGFDLKYETELNADDVKIEYSTNGGVNWTRLGNTGDFLNWYNGTNEWTNSSNEEWIHVEHEIYQLIGESCVIFRIYFHSDGGAQKFGIAFDNFEIKEPSIDAAVTNVTGCHSGEYGLDVHVKNVGAFCSNPNNNINYGNNLATGGTASAEEAHSSSPANQAFNGDNTTLGWGNNNGAMPTWLQYDYGAGNSETINAYKIYCSSTQTGGWGSENYNPKTWIFEGSDDALTWTTLDNITDGTLTMNEWKGFTFTNSTAYRYYRINISSNESGNWSHITELQLHNAIIPTTSTDITSIDIGYSIDGAAPIIATFNSPADFIAITPGSIELITVLNVTIPETANIIDVWCKLPNGEFDEIIIDDTLSTDVTTWAHCNDHCSNAIEILSTVTAATQNGNATPDPSEDPDYSGCSGGTPVTIENSVWYYFTTDCNGGDVTVTFSGTNCTPTASGIQVSIDRLDALPECDPLNYTNVFCDAPGDQSNIVWNGLSLPADQVYYITVDGVGGNTCQFEILLEGSVAFNPNTAMSGTISIDPNDVDYPTIQSALDSLDMYGVNAPVIFEMTDIAFTEQLTFPLVCGVSAANTITFTTYCDDCAMATIENNATDATDNYTIELDNGKYYIFDRIKLKSLDADFGRVVDIINETDNIAFQNCVFEGVSTTTNSNNHTLIYSSQESAYSLNFTGNTFVNGATGLYLEGNSSATLMNFIDVENNIFENQSFRGVSLINQNQPDIIKNEIITNSTRTDFTGIYLQTAENNTQIYNNQIYAITADGTGLFLDDISGDATEQPDIYNNMISIGNANASYGIDIVSTTGSSEYINFYYNSLNNNSATGFAFRVNTANNLVLKNNIFNSAGTAENFDQTSLTASTIDYNNFFDTGIVGTVGTNARINNPNFLGVDDLHTKNTSLANGTPIAGISLDIDEETRQNPPYIGADEYLGLVSWTGATNTDWNNSGNWSSGQVPTYGTTVQIPNVTNYPEVNSKADKLAEVENMTIDAGSHVWIEPMKYLTIHKNLNQNGELILKSDATGNASLIAYGTVTNGGGATTKSELYLTDFMWHYIGSPITNANATLFNYTPDFYWYNESTADTWLNDEFTGTMGWTMYPTGTMQTGRGYAVRTENGGTQTVEFTGEHNNGNISINLTHTDNTGFHGNTIFDGWNLVSNPYPSTINWNEESVTKTNIDNAVYVYADNGSGAFNNYLYYVAGQQNSPYSSIALNQGTCYVPPMQGFYVRANAAGASVQLNNLARAHSNSQFHKNDKKGDEPKIFLQLEKDGITDQTALRFIPEATTEYDGEYDALKLYTTSTQVPQIYFITSTEGMTMAINSLPEIYNELEVPLGIKAGTSGEYKISIPEMQLADTVTAYLKDAQTNSIFEIINNFSYSFYTETGRFEDRLSIVFEITENTDVEAEKDQQIVIYSNSNNVYITINEDDIDAKVEIFSIVGQKVYEGNLTATHTQIPIHSVSGNYIVKVIKQEAIFMEKVFIGNYK